MKSEGKECDKREGKKNESSEDKEQGLSATLAPTYQILRCHVTGDRHFNIYHCENLKSETILVQVLDKWITQKIDISYYSA
jgi:hypothetical protein